MSERRDTGDRTPGRPRDERLDRAVIEATIGLLEESGFAATTITAISRRSGVPTPTMYRRWANRIEVIEAAVFPAQEAVPPVPTGDLRHDLQAFLDTITAPLQRPAARAAMPGLLAAYQADPTRYDGVTFRLGGPIRRAFHDLLADQPVGSIDRSIDPDSVLDLLAASALYATFIRPFTGRAEPTTSVVELVLTAVRRPAA